ncbi:hypothetical protein BLOT_014817 [Blomia tropicalis]|nr:hypothetical protein BLOT_014817 [Blomia tropicalis]
MASFPFIDVYNAEAKKSINLPNFEDINDPNNSILEPDGSFKVKQIKNFASILSSIYGSYIRDCINKVEEFKMFNWYISILPNLSKIDEEELDKQRLEKIASALKNFEYERIYDFNVFRHKGLKT